MGWPRYNGVKDVIIVTRKLVWHAPYLAVVAAALLLRGQGHDRTIRAILVAALFIYGGVERRRWLRKPPVRRG